MADKDKGGDKTELPTPKKLQDARKKGDIAKAREITTTVGTFGWLLVMLVLAGHVGGRLTGFADRLVGQAATGDFATTMTALGTEAIWLLIGLMALIMLPICGLNLVTEMLQTRGLFAAKKLEPKFENLDPVQGFKRMFGSQGLVELVKTLAKVITILAVLWVVGRDYLPVLGSMLGPASEPVWRDGLGPDAAMHDAGVTRMLTIQVLGAVGIVFVFVAALDFIWSRHSFTKKMMMSRRDIRDEVKRDEGDPHIKGHRRQLAQEWAQSGAIASTTTASALLVNPTHLAIALDFDPVQTPVPVIAARGEEQVALAMRDEAIRAGVPIVRHIPTARALWARGEVGEIVPEDMFDAIAEVILWARRAREGKAPMECDLAEETQRREQTGEAKAAA